MEKRLLRLVKRLKGMRNVIDPYQIFESNIGLVRLAMRRFKNPSDDLFQSGLMGLFKACVNYDENKGFKFSTFAMPHIINEMKKESKNALLVRIPDEVYKVLSYIKNDELYSLDALSEKLNVKKKHIMDALFFKSFLMFDESLYYKENDRIILYLHDLNEEERKINFLYYYHNLYKSDIAKIMEISPQKVSKILNKSLEIIKRNIKV